MQKLTATSLGVFLFAFGITPNAGLADRNDIPNASGASLFDVIADHTLSGKTRWGDPYHQFFRFDGVAFQRLPRRSGKVVHDMGTWRVEGEKLCWKWTIRNQGRESCNPVDVAGDRIEIHARRNTRVVVRTVGDTKNLASIAETGAVVDRSKAGGRGKLSLIYVSAWDCPSCQFVSANVVPDLRKELQAVGIGFREVSVHSFIDIKEAARWPEDLEWLRTKMRATRGTPRWFLITKQRVVGHAFGKSGHKKLRDKAESLIAKRAGAGR